MPFTWTYTKIKNFEDCPKRHHEVDVAKNYKDGDGESLKWGNYVHDQLAAACQGRGKLDDQLQPYQKWVDRVKDGPGALLVEQKYALTRDLQKTAYFSPTVWFRGIGDVVRVAPPVALVLDWKTGKILDNPVQLGLMAQCIFAHYPDVMKVRSEYVWLKEDATTPEVFDRKDMGYLWSKLLPRVTNYENALTSQTFPPKPGGLCMRYCPVTSCPFYKKGSR